jgi:hypothetical protein
MVGGSLLLAVALMVWGFGRRGALLLPAFP